MERLQAQATKFTKLVFDPKTAETYSSTLTLTIAILTELVQLIWLAICSVLVVGNWIGDNAIRLGRDSRQWLNAQSSTEGDSTQAAVSIGESIMKVSKDGAGFLVDKAYAQLGMEKPARPAEVVKEAKETVSNAVSKVVTSVKESADAVVDAVKSDK
jgi:hypothetical protein